MTASTSRDHQDRPGQLLVGEGPQAVLHANPLAGFRRPDGQKSGMTSLLDDVYEGKRVPRGTPLRRAAFFCRTALRERGWTDRLVENVLGPEDLTRPNPYGWDPHTQGYGLYPVRLWRKERVYRAERLSAFVNRPRRKRAPLIPRPRRSRRP
jgi:hypothetical protein